MPSNNDPMNIRRGFDNSDTTNMKRGIDKAVASIVAEIQKQASAVKTVEPEAILNSHTSDEEIKRLVMEALNSV
jgi:chaperonin GroEL (HSP60 family)